VQSSSEPAQLGRAAQQEADESGASQSFYAFVWNGSLHREKKKSNLLKAANCIFKLTLSFADI